MGPSRDASCREGSFVDPTELEAASQLGRTRGKASITLPRDGKIVNRGVDVVSRASGTHRIRGAVIELS